MRIICRQTILMKYHTLFVIFEKAITCNDVVFSLLQDIVPQSLLENYLGMIDPSRAQTVDTEITKYCAYNLPAVAYTLGRKNWHCIKNLYETLAADMQVKKIDQEHWNRITECVWFLFVLILYIPVNIFQSVGSGLPGISWG